MMKKYVILSTVLFFLFFRISSAEKIVSAEIDAAADDTGIIYLNGKTITYCGIQVLSKTAVAPSLFKTENILAAQDYNYGGPQGIGFLLIIHTDSGRTIYKASDDEDAGWKSLRYGPGDPRGAIPPGQDLNAPAPDWAKYDFDDSSWDAPVNIVEHVKFPLPQNPDTGLTINALNFFPDGKSDNGYDNSNNYYRRKFRLDFPTPTATPPDTVTFTQTPIPSYTTVLTATETPPFSPTMAATPTEIPTRIVVFTEVIPSPSLTEIPLPPTPKATQVFIFTPKPSPSPLPAMNTPTTVEVYSFKPGVQEAVATTTPSADVELTKSLAVSYEDNNEMSLTYQIKWKANSLLKEGLVLTDILPSFLELKGISKGGKYNSEKNEIRFLIKGPVSRNSRGEIYYIAGRKNNGEGEEAGHATAIYKSKGKECSVVSNEVTTKLEP